MRACTCVRVCMRMGTYIYFHVWVYLCMRMNLCMYNMCVFVIYVDERVCIIYIVCVWGGVGGCMHGRKRILDFLNSFP